MLRIVYNTDCPQHVPEIQNVLFSWFAFGNTMERRRWQYYGSSSLAILWIQEMIQEVPGSVQYEKRKRARLLLQSATTEEESRDYCLAHAYWGRRRNFTFPCLVSASRRRGTFEDEGAFVEFGKGN